MSVTVLSDDAAVDGVMSWRERLRVVEARVEVAEARVVQLSEQVGVLSRMLFGQLSEKSRPVPGSASDSLGEEGGQAGAGVAKPAKLGRGQQRGSRGHGRWDYSYLETEEVIHDVAEGLWCCADCGLEFEFLGSKTSDQVDWWVTLV